MASQQPASAPEPQPATTTAAYFQPQPQLREVPLQPQQSALLFIDTQNFNCHRQGACFRHCSTQQLEGPEYAYWWRRLADCIPRWQQLQQACRAAGVEVMYTVIQSLTKDGRDRGLDYKISGFHVPPGCWDAQVVDQLQPAEDEIVLPKTSSSVFVSTNIHYILQNLGVKQLLLVGCVTDQCVAHADCCVAYSQERHDAACRMVAGYCRQRTTQQVLEELST